MIGDNPDRVLWLETHDYLMGEATSITLSDYRNKLVSEFAPICRNRYAIIINQEFPSRNATTFFDSSGPSEIFFRPPSHPQF